MSYLPISLNITNKKILFVGGGKVAMHKLKAVQQFTSNITIVATEIIPEILELGFSYKIQSYEASLLQGFSIVFACTNNRAVNQQIKTDAEALNILVNVADDAELCDFISPAIFKDGDFTISVSSGGKNVVKAVKLRNEIQEIYKGKL